MQRRTFLTATTSVTATGFLSGCTGGDGNESGSGGTPTKSGEAKTASHLNSAGEALQSAGEELATESENLSESDIEDGGVDIQPSTVNSYLDEASSELDAAEETATDNLLAQIEAARTYVSFARKLVEFLDVFAEGYSRTATGFTYFDSGRYSDAVEEFDEGQTKFEESNDLLTVTQDRSENLDTETLDSIDEIEIDSMKTDLSTLSDLMPVMRALTIGFRHMSEGMIDYEPATENLDNEEYTKAHENFNKAFDHFTAAETHFEDHEESAPESVKSDIIELTCYAGAIKDGCRHLAAAAEAQANGNYDRAESKADEASNAFDRCSFDS
jgi:hypothetical protein